MNHLFAQKVGLDAMQPSIRSYKKLRNVWDKGVTVWQLMWGFQYVEPDVGVEESVLSVEPFIT